MSLVPLKPLPKNKPKNVMDFDCECRPLHWYGGDWVSKEVTAIAWAFLARNGRRTRRGGVHCVLLSEPHDPTPENWEDLNSARWTVPEMLAAFVEAYNEADMVTGHYIRGFDLPLINGALFEHAMQPLGSKLTHDTKGDLVRFSGLSKSQENLGGLLGLHHPKVSMNQASWRSANRLTPEGVQLARRRAAGDVRQHIEMRADLIARGMMLPPRRWTGAAMAEPYHP